MAIFPFLAFLFPIRLSPKPHPQTPLQPPHALLKPLPSPLLKLGIILQQPHLPLLRGQPVALAPDSDEIPHDPALEIGGFSCGVQEEERAGYAVLVQRGLVLVGGAGRWRWSGRFAESEAQAVADCEARGGGVEGCAEGSAVEISIGLGEGEVRGGHFSIARYVRALVVCACQVTSRC